MNQVALSGNLTKDPEFTTVSTAAGALPLCKFCVAVQRAHSKNKEVDFINCTAWGSTASYIDKYGAKGSKILLAGEIKVGSYQKDGESRKSFEINVQSAELLSKKSEDSSSKNYTPVDDIDGQLPF